MGDQSMYLSHMPHVLYINLAPSCITVVVFCLMIISDATKEFLPGDDKELLN